MPLPLRHRIVLLSVLALIPAVFVASAATIQVVTRYLWEEAEADAVSLADAVRRAAIHAMRTRDREEMRDILESFSGVHGVLTARLYDQAGVLRVPVSPEGRNLDILGPQCTACHPDPRRKVVAGGICSHRTAEGLRVFTPVRSEPECSAGECHKADGPVLGFLEVELDASMIRSRVEGLAGNAAFWGGVILVAAVVPLLLGLRWMVGRPLAECLRLVRGVQGGDLAVRSRVRRSDEVGQLLDAFDSMAESLGRSRAELEALNRDLHGQVAARTRELEAALEAARESDHMKTEFLAGISHELSTPLQAVIGYSELLLDGIDGELNEAQRRDVEAVFRNGRVLLMMVEDLLELARLEGQSRVLCIDRIRIEDVVEETAAIGRRLASGKPLQVEVALPPRCPAVPGDLKALRDVFFHLVENAVRHTEEGRVDIAVRTVGVGRLEVLVTDTGPGADSLVVRSALRGFVPKQGGGGVGVGLALARRLVELHGGSLEVSAAQGGGTRVRVELPAAAESEPAAGSSA